MYERFTDRARKVMQLANQEAQRLSHEYIDPGHTLLGIVKEGSGVAANILKNTSIDLHKIRLAIETRLPPGNPPGTPGKLPQTPRSKKVIEYAIQEAREFQHNYIGTEHFLLGILHDTDSVAGEVLKAEGLTLDKVREELRVLLWGREELQKKIPPKNPETVVHIFAPLVQIEFDRPQILAHCGTQNWTVAPDGAVVWEAKGTFDLEKPVTEAEYQRLRPQFPVKEGFKRECARWLISQDGKTLTYEFRDREVLVTPKDEPLSFKSRVLVVLRYEMEKAKKESRMDTACTLLRIIKQVEEKD